jgi:hypothetical protein
VVILAGFGPNVQQYCRQFSQLVFPRPDACPLCGAVDQLIGHGSYRRTVCDHQNVFPIRVKRLLCKICHRTLSLLPSFCLPHRHYLASTIQRVISLRIQTDSSWKAIRQGFQPSDVPTRTTCREWTASFIHASKPYLQHLMRQLAIWQLAPGKLELAVDDVAGSAKTGQQLLTAFPHLLAWLNERGLKAGDGSNWLVTLSRWGQAAKLGRLV